jgi:Flp pilus assembly CpaE family ATPase
LWQDLITRPAGDFDILTSTRSTAAGELEIEQVRKVLGFTRMRYRWVVLDLGRLTHFSKQAIGWADDILLVTSPGISELHQCKHAIEIMDDLCIDREKIRLVLNRKDTGRPWSQKEIQNLFGIEISAVLPPSHEELYTAYLRKSLPPPTSKLRSKIAELSRRVAGLPEPLPKRSFSLKAIKILQFGVVNHRHAAAAAQERSAP